MANVYVRSAAAGTGTGADWTNAFTTLAAALTAGAAGDSFWVSEDHAETGTSAKTMTSPGTVSNPCFVYCVDHSGSVPPVSADLRTTATITTTSTGDMTTAGSMYVYGIIFSCGTSLGRTFRQLSGSGFQNFKSCAFRFASTSTCSLILGSNTASNAPKVTWENCTFQVASVGSRMVVDQCDFAWRNTASAITGATIPTTLFGSNAGGQCNVVIEGVDLSAIGTGKTLVGNNGTPQRYLFKDCKLGSSVTIAAASTDAGGPEVSIIRCDTAGNYRHEKAQYMGTQTTETTIIRTGGASDGTTSIAAKIVTTANSKWVLPFEAIPIAIWNDSTTAITTLTIYGTTTGGGVPKDDEIWIDVEYLGSAGDPQGSFKTSTKADNLAASAATNNSADGSTWGGGGAGNGFKIVCPSFTPAQKGAISIYVRAAKASVTYYIDPRPSISGVTVAKSEILAPGIYANELSSGGASAVQYRPSMSGNV
jgi:hypothetical protein